MGNELQQAINFIKSGDKKHGGQILAEIVKREPKNENAWLWLASCVSVTEQRTYCLRKVLEINPNNQIALNALQKLQQPEQPTEQEIIGDEKSSAEQSLVSVNHSHIEQISRAENLVGQKAPASFQPKFFTAVAGIGVVLGTIFTWSVNETQASGIIKQHTGWTETLGQFTFVVGLVIMFLALFHKTNPDKANSPISSILGAVTWLAVFWWKNTEWDCDVSVLLGDPNGICYTPGGFGYSLSMLSLFLVIILGLIRNPSNQGLSK